MHVYCALTTVCVCVYVCVCVLPSVLPEASHYCANNEYLTLKEKVHKVGHCLVSGLQQRYGFFLLKLIQIRSTTLSKEHDSFCQTLRTHLASKTQPDTEQLLHSVHHHFSEVHAFVHHHDNTFGYNFHHVLNHVDCGTHLHTLQ